MKFAGFVDIAKDRETVVRLFRDPAHLGEYQEGFVRKEALSGKPGAVGARSRLHYAYKDRSMELEETIIENNLPDHFAAFYSHQHMDNTMHCEFEALDEHTTRYHYAFEYTRINWIMPKLMAILFPSMYRKQGEKWQQNFKEFVENWTT
ncbi:MAG: SRPBCC family protein [Saprospiraceae bacterium]|nr:SRPBCC family protein [Saprospiraceae bacterium]